MCHDTRNQMSNGWKSKSTMFIELTNIPRIENDMTVQSFNNKTYIALNSPYAKQPHTLPWRLCGCSVLRLFDLPSS